jgi:hypothetical protein
LEQLSFILVSKTTLSKPLSGGFGVASRLSLGAVSFTLLTGLDLNRTKLLKTIKREL